MDSLHARHNEDLLCEELQWRVFSEGSFGPNVVISGGNARSCTVLTGAASVPL